MKEQNLKKQFKLAELVTLTISSILVLAVVVFLIIELVQKGDEFVVIDIQADLQKTQEREGRFIVPVRVLNRGDQTLSEVAIRAVTLAGKGGAPHDFSLDYLGAKSTENVYMIFDSDPRNQTLVFKTLHYQID